MDDDFADDDFAQQPAQPAPGRPSGSKRKAPSSAGLQQHPSTIQRICELGREGLTHQRISATLHDEGLVNSKGGRWARTTDGKVIERVLGRSAIPFLTAPRLAEALPAASTGPSAPTTAGGAGSSAPSAARETAAAAGATADEDDVFAGEPREPDGSSTVAPSRAPTRPTTPIPVVAERAPPPRQLQAARCPMCTQDFGASGRHQVCSLPCGHVYGRSCITSHLFRKSTCPLCAAAARRSTIRLLFASAQQPAAADAADAAAAPTALELEARAEEAACERLEAELAALVAEQSALERRASDLQAARLLGGKAAAPAAPPQWCARPRPEPERRTEPAGEWSGAPAYGGADRHAGLLFDRPPLNERRDAAANAPAAPSAAAAASDAERPTPKPADDGQRAPGGDHAGSGASIPAAVASDR